ncbi:MAG: LPD38 domain-containing protein [Amphritea sp.]
MNNLADELEFEEQAAMMRENSKEKGPESTSSSNTRNSSPSGSEGKNSSEPSEASLLASKDSIASEDVPRFSRQATTADQFGIPSESLISSAISKIADKFKVLKDLQSNITDAGGDIGEASDAYMAEELFHGKAENDLRQMRDAFVEPLAKKMAEFGISREKLDQYLYAKHAAERNAHIAEINPELQEGGSGMTDAEAVEIISTVAESGQQAQHDQVASIVYDMLAARRDEIKNNGLEDSSLIDAWESTYEYYVPLKGFSADERKDGLPRAGKGFTIGGKESKRAMGRSSQAASPLSYTVQDLTETLIRKRKNEVGNAFLNLVEENPNTGYWEVFTDENPETDRRIVKRKNAETGEMEEVVKEQPIPMAMMTDRYFTTKRDGKTYYIKLEDPRLMKAMKNIGPDTSNFLIQGLSTVNRLLSSLNTSYNPEFVVGNFARDIQTAVLNLSAEQSRDDGKINGEAIVKQTVKDVPKAMRAAYRGLRGKQPKNAEWAQWFEEFREAGAKTGYFDMKDIDGQAKDVQQLIDIANGGFKGGFLKWTKASARLVEDANNAVENAVRLSAYVNARKAGISKAKAASLAKNMTVNFNRRGEMGTTLNALYMFANASIQGTVNFTRTMVGLKGEKGDPTWSRLSTAQKIAAGMMGAAYGIAMANRMAAGDDDDGENFYDKIPQYVKERNIVLMKSLFGGEQDGSYWKIPLPYGYNIFHVFGTSTEAVTNGNTEVGQAATDLALAALGSFSPIGFQNSDSVHGMILKNVTPTIGKPIVDVALNENFMGSSIYNKNFPFGTPKPDSSLSRRSTPEGYKAIAEFLNEVSGGSQWRSGAIDINPDVMRYFVDYFSGGAGAFVASKVPKNAYNLYNGVELPAHRTVFLSRINGKVLPYDDQSKFYDRRDEIGQIQEEFKALRGADRMAFYRENKGKMALRGQIKATEKRLKAMRKQRDRIYNMDLSPAARDRQLKEVELKMKAVIDRFNLRYGKAGS